MQPMVQPLPRVIASSAVGIELPGRIVLSAITVLEDRILMHTLQDRDSEPWTGMYGWTLRDDCGFEYTWLGGGAGGGGADGLIYATTAWTPAPPSAAKTLLLTVDTQDGSTTVSISVPT